VNGSGISLGHPVGATGVRILTTMLREIERRGARYGLETMCIGGGHRGWPQSSSALPDAKRDIGNASPLAQVGIGPRLGVAVR